jgi:hypothetical protein
MYDIITSVLAFRFILDIGEKNAGEATDTGRNKAIGNGGETCTDQGQSPHVTCSTELIEFIGGPYTRQA